MMIIIYIAARLIINKKDMVLEGKLIIIELYMKGNMKMINLMGLGGGLLRMGVVMKENGNMVCFMGKGNLLINHLELYKKGYGKIINLNFELYY
jgi:hypothetical protein